MGERWGRRRLPTRASVFRVRCIKTDFLHTHRTREAPGLRVGPNLCPTFSYSLPPLHRGSPFPLLPLSFLFRLLSVSESTSTIAFILLLILLLLLLLLLILFCYLLFLSDSLLGTFLALSAQIGRDGNWQGMHYQCARGGSEDGNNSTGNNCCSGSGSSISNHPQ